MKTGNSLILVADDDTLIRELIADALEAAGMRVAQAPGVAGALAVLRKESVGILVTDFNMGDGTAFDLIDRARKENVLPPEVVLVSGTYEGNETTRSQRGIAAYFQKPLDIDDLVRFCEASQLRSKRSSGSP